MLSNVYNLVMLALA